MSSRLRTDRFRRDQRPRSKTGTYWPRPYLLTKNESAFFRVLAAAIGDRYLISCKVRLADIVTCSQRDWKRGHANRIAQKHIDFVISSTESSRIVAAIELDDRSHERPQRRMRDAFVNDLFKQTRIRLIRIPATWNYRRDMVAHLLEQAGFFTENRR